MSEHKEGRRQWKKGIQSQSEAGNLTGLINYNSMLLQFCALLTAAVGACELGCYMMTASHLMPRCAAAGTWHEPGVDLAGVNSFET